MSDFDEEMGRKHDAAFEVGCDLCRGVVLTVGGPIECKCGRVVDIPCISEETAHEWLVEFKARCAAAGLFDPAKFDAEMEKLAARGVPDFAKQNEPESDESDDELIARLRRRR